MCERKSLGTRLCLGHVGGWKSNLPTPPWFYSFMVGCSVYGSPTVKLHEERNGDLWIDQVLLFLNVGMRCYYYCHVILFYPSFPLTPLKHTYQHISSLAVIAGGQSLHHSQTGIVQVTWPAAATSCVEDGGKQLRVKPKAAGRRGSGERTD